MEYLALQVASGILIAVIFITAARYSVALWRGADYGMAVLLAIPVVLFGGGIVAAGLGIVAW